MYNVAMFALKQKPQYIPIRYDTRLDIVHAFNYMARMLGHYAVLGASKAAVAVFEGAELYVSEANKKIAEIDG